MNELPDGTRQEDRNGEVAPQNASAAASLGASLAYDESCGDVSAPEAAAGANFNTTQ